VNFHANDVVVLNTDLPAQGLKRGDLGAVVEIYSSDAMDVEFVTASGRTQALITVRPSDIREVAADDLVAVRPGRYISHSQCLTPPVADGSGIGNDDRGTRSSYFDRHVEWAEFSAS
jgi:hypothetical protein